MEITNRKSRHDEHAEGWGMWLRADEFSRRAGVNDGMIANGSSSSAYSGHGQTEEESMKMTPGKERQSQAGDVVDSVESFPRPNMGSHSPCLTVDRPRYYS